MISLWYFNDSSTFVRQNYSLHSMRLELVGTRKNGRPRGSSLTSRVSPSRAPVLSFAHYFRAPARQANKIKTKNATLHDLELGSVNFSAFFKLFPTSKSNGALQFEGSS